ncbi:hypothetical protein [Sinomonas sp. P10A9]|uniref:Uncharacterized protein n=1 Tax=Sinomonas puerhi TaxID=3238584 RepID=A0AB39KZN0_9MICC
MTTTTTPAVPVALTRKALDATIRDLGGKYVRSSQGWHYWHIPTPVAPIEVGALIRQRVTHIGVDRVYFPGALTAAGNRPWAEPEAYATLLPYLDRAVAAGASAMTIPGCTGPYSECAVVNGELDELLRRWIAMERRWIANPGQNENEGDGASPSWQCGICGELRHLNDGHRHPRQKAS